MAIKTKNQQQVPNQEAAGVMTEERLLRVNPELDARLSVFMEKNSKTTEYYAGLVKENPERAVRSLMLGKMLKHERQMRLVERQLPQVKEWVAQQPGLMERIIEKIKNVSELYKEKAFVNEAARAKVRIDFSPRTGMSQSV